MCTCIAINSCCVAVTGRKWNSVLQNNLELLCWNDLCDGAIFLMRWCPQQVAIHTDRSITLLPYRTILDQRIPATIRLAV